MPPIKKHIPPHLDQKFLKGYLVNYQSYAKKYIEPLLPKELKDGVDWSNPHFTIGDYDTLIYFPLFPTHVSALGMTAGMLFRRFGGYDYSYLKRVQNYMPYDSIYYNYTAVFYETGLEMFHSHLLITPRLNEGQLLLPSPSEADAAKKNEYLASLLDELVAMADKEKNGKIKIDDFIEAVAKLRDKGIVQDLYNPDLNGDGYIDYQEMIFGIVYVDPSMLRGNGEKIRTMSFFSFLFPSTKASRLQQRYDCWDAKDPSGFWKEFIDGVKTFFRNIFGGNRYCKLEAYPNPQPNPPPIPPNPNPGNNNEPGEGGDHGGFSGFGYGPSGGGGSPFGGGSGGGAGFGGDPVSPPHPSPAPINTTPSNEEKKENKPSHTPCPVAIAHEDHYDGSIRYIETYDPFNPKDPRYMFGFVGPGVRFHDFRDIHEDKTDTPPPPKTKPCPGDPLPEMEIAPQKGQSGLEGGMFCKKCRIDRNGIRKDHKGIDIKNPYGAPVYDAYDGIATSLTQSKDGILIGAGYYVQIISILANGKKMRTLYFHLQKDKRASGKVKAGDIIEYQGNSGNLKEAIDAKRAESHLHYETEVNGAKVDPMPYLGTTINTQTGKSISKDCN